MHVKLIRILTLEEEHEAINNCHSADSVLSPPSSENLREIHFISKLSVKSNSIFCALIVILVY